jgi:hypothetical protein
MYSIMLEGWKQLLNIVGTHYEKFQLLAGLRRRPPHIAAAAAVV